MRQCSKCSVDLVPGVNWTKAAIKVSHLRCRECRAKYAADWYQKNSAHHSAVTKIWRAKNRHKTRAAYTKYKTCAIGRAKSILSGIRARSVKKGLAFDLDDEWLAKKIEHGICEVTGIQFDMSVGKRVPFGPSVDRIDSDLGYTKDNCQVVAFIYNAAKVDFSHEQVVTFAVAIVDKLRRDYAAATSHNQVTGGEGSDPGK